MTNRSNRDAKYVLVQSRKPKATANYYADDDYHSQVEPSTRRIVRTRPRDERHVKYVTSDELDGDYRRERWPPSNEVRIDTHGEMMLFTIAVYLIL